jgi:predicted Zn-dependent peptidase
VKRRDLLRAAIVPMAGLALTGRIGSAAGSEMSDAREEPRPGRAPGAPRKTAAQPGLAEADVFRATLGNGLRAVVRERPGSEVVAVSVAARGGSRDEEAETVGAAHFMEHMYFQGTPRRPDSVDIDRDVEARGGWANAWTGWESINFQIVAPGDSFDLALDVIADQMVNSLFAAEKVDKERQVVLEELIRGLNTPSERAQDLFLPAVFGDHPARHLPIGSRETINQSTRDVLVRFRDTYFVAGNMAVAVAGTVEHEQVFRSLDAAFAGLRTGPVPPFVVAPIPPARANLVTAASPGQQARIVLGGPGPGQLDPDRYPLHVIVALLGTAGRRLESEIVDRRGLAASVAPLHLELTDVSVWGVSAGLRPANVDPVVELIRTELRRLRDEPPGAEELAEALAYLRGTQQLARERSVDLAEELSEGEVLGTYESIDAYLARVEAVTAADVQRVARAYLDPDEHTLIVLRP